MEGLKIQVSKNIVQVTPYIDLITSGMIGLVAEFTFSSEWQDLTKLAVFKAGSVVKTVKIVDNAVVVPWEVLDKPNVLLRIGVYGVNPDCTLAIPTIWADVSKVYPGADPNADPAMDPTLPVWQDLINRVEDLEESDIEDVDNLQLKKVVCEATPDTLAEIIADAQINTTINLTPGNYELLTLKGKTSYPENLTIIGCEGATMAGVSITSGFKTADALENSDISEAVIPKNLTFEKVQFSDSFCVRNCEITGLTLHECEFLAGACLKVRPNRPDDDYGNDGSGTMSSFNYYATRIAHDVTVSECHFVNANKESKSTAIYMECVDNATIQGNRVDAAAWNGIQVVGRVVANRFYAPASGRIAITSNTIKNTGSHSIRMNRFENADIQVLYNELHSSGLTDDNGTERIKISGFDSTTRVSTRFYSSDSADGVEVNYYGGEKIGVGWGITLEQEPTDIEKNLQEHIDSDNPHQISCGKIGAVPWDEYDVKHRELEKDFQEHTIADNPHNLDYAPGGFGLGKIPTPSVKWSSINRPGFSRSNVDSPDGKSWWGITTATDGGYGAHIAFSREGGILTEAKRLFKTSNKVCSGDWEYVNPPMQLNKEYRTTEISEGKAVYVMLFNFGALPSKDGKKKVFFAPKNVTVVDMYGIVSYTDDSGNAISYPISVSTETPQFYADTTDGCVVIQSTVDLSARTAKVMLKYTKD